MCHRHIKCVKLGYLITSLILLFLHKSFPSLTFLIINLVAQVKKFGVIIDFFPSFLIFNFSVSPAVSAFIIFLQSIHFFPLCSLSSLSSKSPFRYPVIYEHLLCVLLFSTSANDVSLLLLLILGVKC